MSNLELKDFNIVSRGIIYVIHRFLLVIYYTKLRFQLIGAHIRLFFVQPLKQLKRLFIWLRPAFLFMFYTTKVLRLTILGFYLGFLLFVLITGIGSLQFTFLHYSGGNVELIHFVILLFFFIYNEVSFKPSVIFSVISSIMCFNMIRVVLLSHSFGIYVLCHNILFTVVLY